MKKALFAVAMLLSIIITGNAQQITYSEHIAPIIYTHCTYCHRPGEIGPMPFTSYNEVSAWAGMISYVTENKYMPPWRANKHYSRFLGENFLSDAQINAIKTWALNGAPQGDPSLEPALPTYPSGSQLGTPDLVLSFSEAFQHKGTNQDDYHIFVLPTGLLQDVNVAAIELRPGNKSIVHHALFSWDTSGVAAQQDAQTPEYGYTNFGGFGVTGQNVENHQFPTYTPGQTPRKFPSGMAQKLPAGSDLLIQMHYAPTTVDEWDSSTVNIFFADPPVTRQIQQYVMLPFGNTLTNGPFVIGAGQTPEFHGKYTVPANVSLISVFPHMHLLGAHWEVYAVHPNGDTTQLIEIPTWDFNWQGYYYFPSLVKLERNTVLHAYAKYDNTIDNPYNPNNPPQVVSWGEGTEDEMFYLAFNFALYNTGDENTVFPDDSPVHNSPDLNIDSTTSVGTVLSGARNRLFPVFPNPAKDQVTLTLTIDRPSDLSISVHDTKGTLVKNITSNVHHHTGKYDITVDTRDLSAGSYFVRVETQVFNATEQFVIIR